MNKKLITLAVQAILFSSTAITTAIYAAEQPQNAETTATESAEKDNGDAKAADADKIVITGSRIRRDSFSIPTPLVTMSREDIADTGLGSLSEILVENMPQINPGSSNSNTQSSVSTTGLSTIALRNLGTNRTLTLIDGRRVVSNSYSGNYVSLSTIPSGMVDRVEIISGGASATYGSDAVAGVVNIITQQDKQGFSFKGRAGESTEGGAKEHTLDVNYGSFFDNERGYFYISATKDRQYGLFYEDRKRAQIQEAYSYDDDLMCNAMQISDGSDPCMRDIDQSQWASLSDGTLGGVFLESSRNDTQFWYDENGLRDDWRGNEELYGVDSNQWVALKIPDEALTAAVKIDYDITPDTSSYFQVQFSKNESINVKSPEDEYEGASALVLDPVTGAPSSVSPGYISINNPYVPQEMIDSNPYRNRIYWDRRFAEVGEITTDNTRTTVRTWAGLQGSMFEGDWDWDLSAGFGKFKQEQTRLNELNTFRVRNALDAEYAADGVTIQCADADARAEGCAPLNLFGIGSISKEAADYIRSNPTITTDIEQVNVLGYITGDLFEMPAGMVSAVFGAEYRKDTQDLKTSAEQQYGGITFNIVPAFKGEVEVYEAFGEAAIPLLRDVAGAKNLTAEVSLRVADYSMDNVGMVSSYKAGLIWEPVEGYAVRANYARAQRAPTITELMSPPRGDYDSFTDICVDTTATSTNPGHDNCRLEPAIAAVIAADGIFEGDDNNYSPNTGNPDLKEETADTYTLGITLAPAALEGFRMAIDYYQITVSDAIAEIDNDDILTGCYDSPSNAAWGSDNIHCNNIRRNTDGEIIEILQREYNLDELKTRGYDIAAEYRFDLDDIGSFKLKADMTHVIEHSKSFSEDGVTVTNQYAGILNEGIFKDRASVSLTWVKDDWRVRWSTKYKGPVIDSQSRHDDYYAPLDEDGHGGFFPVNEQRCAEGLASCIENPEAPAFHNIASYITHSLSVSYETDIDNDSSVRIFGGVNNVFDDRGAFILGGRGNFDSDYGGGVGRFAYLGAEFKY